MNRQGRMLIMTFAFRFMALSQTQSEEPQMSMLVWLFIAAAWTLIVTLRLALFLAFRGRSAIKSS